MSNFLKQGNNSGSTPLNNELARFNFIIKNNAIPVNCVIKSLISGRLNPASLSAECHDFCDFPSVVTFSKAHIAWSGSYAA